MLEGIPAHAPRVTPCSEHGSPWWRDMLTTMAIEGQVVRTTARILAALFGASLPLVAQEAFRAEQVPQFRENLEETRTRLELSDDQLEEVQPILAAGFKAVIQVLLEHGLDLEDSTASAARLDFEELSILGADLQAVRDETLKDLEPVLTADQLEEYKQIQAERREATRERLMEYFR